ncbi:hypothetical protein ACFFRR_011095 [Megaselia abdita]
MIYCLFPLASLPRKAALATGTLKLLMMNSFYLINTFFPITQAPQFNVSVVPARPSASFEFHIVSPADVLFDFRSLNEDFSSFEITIKDIKLFNAIWSRRWAFNIHY